MKMPEPKKKHPLCSGVVYVPLVVLLAICGCATANPNLPVAPCHAWVAAEASWRALDTYVGAQLEQQRTAACYPPTPRPPDPARPLPMPAEPAPPPPVAPPAQVPLPGLLHRQE